MKRIIIIIIFFHITSQSKMIPIIKDLKDTNIKIAYYIDDKCEDCLKNMTPCEKHYEMQNSKYLKIQWQKESYVEEIRELFGDEIAERVRIKLQED